MGNLTTMFVFVIFFNLLMGLSQLSILSLNPDNNAIVYYNGTGGILESYKTNNNLETIDPRTDFPTSGQEVADDSNNNFFFDPIGTILKWFRSKLDFVFEATKAPFTFARAILPDELDPFVEYFGWAWYLFSFLVILVFIFRGSD